MKKIFFIYKIMLLLAVLFVSFSSNIYASKKKVLRVVLDAGHGGKDPGCHGVYSNEKTITLNVIQRVNKMLKDSFKNEVSTILTRDEDIFPPNNFATIKQSLIYRTDVANKAQGDFFVSVHVNSSPRRNSPTKGTLVLVCGQDRVEEQKGSIGEHTDNLVESENLLDDSDPATQIIIAQYSQAFLAKSIVFAEKLNQEFINQGRVTYGVKQQSLQVLASSAMPGVLIEIGFLNNTDEENYLNSEEGLNEVAVAIFNSIKYYKAEIEKQQIEIKIEN